MDEKILKEKNDDLAKNASMVGELMCGGILLPDSAIELEDNVFIPRSRYDELLQAETKLKIIIADMNKEPDSYKYDKVIKAVLREDVKENAE